MAIWQAMKGDSQNPKRFWNRRDLKLQHFSRNKYPEYSSL